MTRLLALGLFGSGPGEAIPRLIGADAWFDRHEADRYELHEHSIRIADDEILTLLLIEDGAMLTDWGSRSSCRR
jgi:hypothetical protein